MRRASFKGNIVVSNLPPNFTDGELAALFDECGLVLGAMIKRWGDETGRAPRGLVDLAPANAVEEAIRSLDGQRIGVNHIKVRKAPEPKPRPPRAPQAPRPAARAPAARQTDEQGLSYTAFAANAAPRPAARKPIVERRSLPRR